MISSILFTGFDPFGGESENPSWLAVSMLPAEINGVKIFRRQLPTSFTRSCETLRSALEDLNPGAVVCTGQAGGRDAISLESTAFNLADARIPDNDGDKPENEIIYPGEAESLSCLLPLEEMCSALNAKGHYTKISGSAGRYVCNRVYYELLRETRGEKPALFVHVPFIPAQLEGKAEGTPAMELERISAALREIAALIAGM